MLAPATTLPTGAIPEWAPRDLWHRIGMELGVFPAPLGTERIERQFSMSMVGMSANRLKGRSFDTAKTDLQGRLMRDMHKLQYLLPRPIPSVGENGQEPVYVHARLRCDTPASRDDDNFARHVIKSLGDAFVGPKWKGQPKKGEKRVPAHGKMIYKGALYEGGWLHDDTGRHWIWTFDIDRKLGPPCLTVTILWDQPISG
jgi:hypothetical protein